MKQHVKRGDFVTIAASGDYGKLWLSMVVQLALLDESDNVLACLPTMTQRAAFLYRLAVPAGEGTGLRKASQVMVDKIMAVRRDRCGAPIGRADDAALLALGRLLVFIVGIAD